MITRGLGRGYQPVKNRGNDSNISKPPSFRGQPVEALKKSIDIPLTTDFKDAMALLKQGYKVQSPSTMKANTYYRLTRELNGKLNILHGEVQDVQIVEVLVNNIPSSCLLAEDWKMFLYVGNKK